MPNPGKYKSVGVSIEAYDKLVFIAEHEDRAIGRQLARMIDETYGCLLYTSPSPRDGLLSRMPSSA